MENPNFLDATAQTLFDTELQPTRNNVNCQFEEYSQIHARRECSVTPNRAGRSGNLPTNKEICNKCANYVRRTV